MPLHVKGLKREFVVGADFLITLRHLSFPIMHQGWRLSCVRHSNQQSAYDVSISASRGRDRAGPSGRFASLPTFTQVARKGWCLRAGHSTHQR